MRQRPAGRATARRRRRTRGWTVSRSRSSKPRSAVRAASSSMLRPGPLGVDVVGRQRRDAAPVVDAGAAAAGRHSSGPTRFGGACTRAFGPSTSRVTAIVAARSSQARRRRCAHRRVRLGPEVLDDHFLHVRRTARATGGCAKIDVGPLGQGLADADSIPVVNGTFEPAGVLEHPQPDGGVLVGRAEVRPARLSNSRRDVVSSIIPIDGATGLSRCSSSQRHDAGVEVRQQPGLLQHPDRHRPHVGQRRVVAVRVAATPRAAGQRSSGRSPRVNSASLQPSAAPCRAMSSTSSGDRYGAVAAGAGRRDERAVVAAVAAQPGQRDEHLAASR